MEPSDRELIESCLRGDQQGWTQLVGRYQRLIYSVARRVASDTDDCADIFQHVCLELYQSLSRLRSDRILPAWLITVTKRRAYAVVRSRRSNILIDGPLDEDSLQIEAVAKEFAVERAIEDLPPRCRNLIRMLYLDIDEPPYSEISRRLGLPVSSIGPTRARCLEKLRKSLT